MINRTMSDDHIKTHTVANSTRVEIAGKIYDNISIVNTKSDDSVAKPKRRKSLDHSKDNRKPERKTSLDHTWEPQIRMDADVRMCKTLCKNEEVKFRTMDRMMDKQKQELIHSQDFAMSKYQKRLERYKKAKSENS